MAYDEKLAQRIREYLAPLPSVEEKKMFRGITFMVDGKICVSASDNELMCRIDPEMNDTALEKKGCRVMIMKGREYKGYVYVSKDVIKSQQEFAYWIELALDFNKRSKSSKKKQKT